MTCSFEIKIEIKEPDQNSGRQNLLSWSKGQIRHFIPSWKKEVNLTQVNLGMNDCLNCQTSHTDILGLRSKGFFLLLLVFFLRNKVWQKVQIHFINVFDMLDTHQYINSLMNW